MDRLSYHKYMFTIAAIWNWVLAIGFLILPRIDMGYFVIAGPVDPPNTMLYFDSLFGLVFAFGLICYFISKSTTGNHGLIAIAVFEKTWVFLMGLSNFLIGQASIWVLVIVLGDLILGMLFLEDLVALRKLQNQ